MEIIWMDSEGAIIPFPSEGKGTLLMMNDRSLSATIPPQPSPYYGASDNVKPAVNPVPAPEQEKYFSLDPLVSEHDREIVYNLPAEGKREFSENIHQYIGQLGNDYGVTVPGEIHGEDAQSTIMNLPVIFHVDVSELSEAIRKLGEIDE